ncbi:MAG TPA: DUF5947 family protein [Pyrinomonadaceae bacterium]
MDNNAPVSAGFDILRRFIRTRSEFVERCDMCSLELAERHPHLVEPATRKIVCACQACALLFSSSADTRYRRVPQDICALPQFQLTDSEWEALMIPINMAFFFHNSVSGKTTVMYPSPAGPTESLLELESWNEIVESNPELKQLEPDTQALLVNRVGDRRDYLIVPIDECYKLVGLIRTKWKGLAGGAEVWKAIDEFFTDLRQRARPAELRRPAVLTEPVAHA